MSKLRKHIIRDQSVVVATHHAELSLAEWLPQVGAGGTAADHPPAHLPAVVLAPEDDPQVLVDATGGNVNRLTLIAIDFPKFVEGRGFSTAYLLRQRYGYKGELRAVGDIGRDHLWQLHRVGFNAFDLREGTDLYDALQAYDDFPERYQTSNDEAQPLFRRRGAAHV
ncbi:MAG: DUF934 domain-containing protein [Rhodocyclaceae bacterium]|nr:DUF934 domain-containing protein [Rhodocyclaceae bacterium]